MACSVSVHVDPNVVGIATKYLAVYIVEQESLLTCYAGGVLELGTSNDSFFC